MNAILYKARLAARGDKFPIVVKEKPQAIELEIPPAPLAPAIEPPSPAAAALVAIASMEPAPVKLPGVAPWRGDTPRLELAPPPPAVLQIVRVCSGEFGFSVEQIQGEARTKAVTLARHVAMYLAHRITKLSLTRIGRKFSYRDHSTVLHACARIRAKIEEDPALKNRVELLEKRIRGN